MSTQRCLQAWKVRKLKSLLTKLGAGGMLSSEIAREDRPQGFIRVRPISLVARWDFLDFEVAVEGMSTSSQ